MKRNRRWIRLNIDYADTEWLAELPGDVRRLWVDLLCYAKAYGTSGTCRPMSPRAFAKRFDTTDENARELLAAAFAGGALTVIENGDWRFTGWQDLQKPDRTAAKRMKRMRLLRRNEA
jgi:hypothetical protein